MSDSITIQLTELEAEWLVACLGMVMHLARHWDNRTTLDHGNRLLAKLTLAHIVADGKDPDEWLAQAQAALARKALGSQNETAPREFDYFDSEAADNA